MSVDTVDDFAFLGLGIWGDGEAWAYGSSGGFGGRRARRSGSDGFGIGGIGGRRIHECEGGGTELCLGGDDFDGAAEDVDGLDGRRHVVGVWKCCCKWNLRERMETLRFFRPLLSCSVGVNGFFR